MQSASLTDRTDVLGVVGKNTSLAKEQLDGLWKFHKNSFTRLLYIVYSVLFLRWNTLRWIYKYFILTYNNPSIPWIYVTESKVNLSTLMMLCDISMFSLFSPKSEFSPLIPCNRINASCFISNIYNDSFTSLLTKDYVYSSYCLQTLSFLLVID